MSVLTLYHVKIQHKIVSKTISPNIIALHQQHKSYMYPNAIYCCNLKSIKVNWSMAKKKRNIKANATKNWKNIIHECYIWKKNNQHPHSCWKYLIVFKMQAKNMKKYYVCQKCIFKNEWIIPHPSAKSIMVLVCPFTSVNIPIKWVDFDSVRASTPPHWQTPLFIKSCSRIGSANHNALQYWGSTLQ